MQVGAVTVVAPPALGALAAALGERADRARDLPGLGRWRPGPLRLFITPDQARFRAMARGRVPEWGAGFALPGARAIVIRADAPDPTGALRHELAHLALHDLIRVRVPLWFDEGYAVVAAGELGRVRSLQLNLAVARGRIPDLEELNRTLRQDALRAEIGYALAGSAMAHLIRLQPSGSLGPLLDRLGRGMGFEDALRAASGYDVDGFERSWRADLRARYNLVLWAMAGGGWAIVALVVVGLALGRRRRDRRRRAELDQGWTVEEEEGLLPETLDQGDEFR